MSEKQLWLEMKNNLPAASLVRIDAQAVPDVDVVLKDRRAGWIELKQLDGWPVRETTKARFGLRADQAIWLMNYARAGGRAYILVKCGNDYLLFEGRDAVLVSKGLPRSEAIFLSRLYCSGKMAWDKLEEIF